MQQRARQHEANVRGHRTWQAFLVEERAASPLVPHDITPQEAFRAKIAHNGSGSHHFEALRGAKRHLARGDVRALQGLHARACEASRTGIAESHASGSRWQHYLGPGGQELNLNETIFDGHPR